MNKRLRLFLLSLGMIIPFSGCNNMGNDKPTEEFSVNKEYIYGMTDLSYQEDGTDYTYTHKLFKNMGVKSVRLWLHCNWILKNPNEYSSNLEKMQAIYNDLLGNGYQIIAMNHSNFHETGLPNSASTTAKPPRDLTDGSSYLKWLDDIETTYYNMVKAFPDIEYWEIDNECNNDDFMPRLGGGTFTLTEKAEIYYDMMYFASKGIHRANPNAKTVMGGLVVNGAEQFLETIYDLIEGSNSWSNNPNDYFEIACWHPYMSVYSESKFINLNNTIYNVIKTREGKDKKVFLTEMGFSEGNGSTPDQIASYIKSMYKAAKESLYYVESMHYFRMYDDYSSTWGSNAEKYFGLFYDPVDLKEIQQGEEAPGLATPKSCALAFQEVAGGTGSLLIYNDYLNGEYDSKFVMHRGLSNEAKENTVAAFELAGQESNAYAIETDVYLTKDKKPVLIHDQNTSEVTFGKVKIDVTTSTYEEVRNVRLPDINGNPNAHQIPSLEEYLNVLNTYNKVGFLELKQNFNSEDLNIILNEIISKNAMDKIVFISFYKDTLNLIRNKYQNAKIMVLCNSFSELDVDLLVEKGYGADCEYQGISDDQISLLKRKGIEVSVWTVNDLEIAKRFGRANVDYITTDKITKFKN